MDKPSLRTVCASRLDSLTHEQRAEYSRRSTATLLATIDWSSAMRVSCYQSQDSLHEVDTSELLAALRQRYPHLTIDTPAPSPDAAQPTTHYDIIIAPLLGYDAMNNRLGRGEGWYDRFLSTQRSAKKIGLAFSIQELETIPTEPHDIPLDSIFTETKKAPVGGA